VQLTLHALNRNRLANRIHVVRDGAEALEFLFCTGAYAQRTAEHGPKVVLLDLKLPLWWMGSRCSGRSRPTPAPG